MLRIENLKLPPGSGDAALRAQVLKVLRLPEERLLALQILRRSIDAREGVHWVYTVEAETANEDAVLRRCRDKRVSRAEPQTAYRLPQAVPTPDCPTVIVGSRTRGTVRRAGTGPGRCPSHFIGTWPPGGGTHRRCRALLVHRGTGPHQ